MDRYQLNMARGFVMPLEFRRKWIRWFFVYVAVMGVVLALTLYDVMRDSRYWLTQREALKQRESQILARQTGYKTVEAYRASLDQKMSACDRDLSAVVAFGKKRFPVAKILMGLMEPLPIGVELSRVDFDVEAGKLGVDVAVPADVKGYDTLTPPNLVAMWEKEPLLMGTVSQISVGTSERMRLIGMNVICWRFSAVLGGN